MNYESYEDVRFAFDLESFIFVSTGNRGNILKGVLFRLYRMAINLNIEELSKTFDFYAKENKNSEFIPFQKNMTAISFLLKRKF